MASTWLTASAAPLQSEEEVAKKLAEIFSEEDRLLEEILEEQYLQDKAWTHRLDEVMKDSMEKQRQLESRMEEFANRSAQQQEKFDSMVEKVKRLVVDYPITPKVTGYKEHDVSTAVQVKEILDVDQMRVLKVREKCLGKVITSRPFEWFFCLVIIINGVFIGFSVEYGLTHVNENQTAFIQIMEIVFFALYTIELLMKIIAWAQVGLLYQGFIWGSDWMWNWFDTFLVLTAIYDIISEAVASDDDEGGGANLMWMRLLRLLKMMKMLRMVRVMRFFRELRIIIGLVGKSIRSMFWAMLMVCLIMYIFGLCFLQGVTGYVFDHDEIPADVKASIEKYWDTLYDCMFTLFASITMGIDYHVATLALREVGEVFHFLFLFYIAFTTFAVLNVLSGIFVDSSFEAADEDRIRVIKEVKKEQTRQGNHFKDLFQDWCDKGPDYMSQQAFIDCLRWDPNIRETLDSLEISVQEAQELYEDCYAGGGKVSTEDLATGLQRLKGDAMAVDLVVMEHNCRKFTKELDAFMKYVEEYFNAMRLAMESRFGHSHRSKLVVSLTARLKFARKVCVKLFA